MVPEGGVGGVHVPADEGGDCGGGGVIVPEETTYAVGLTQSPLEFEEMDCLRDVVGMLRK
jgi:hypothetical protein